MAVAKRQLVTIKRPATSLDSRGQETGGDTTVAEDVFCSIEELSGRELELARQVHGSATHRVRCYLDPGWSVTSGDYLVEAGSDRRLHIGFIQNPEFTGRESVLTCGEEV